MSEPVLLYGVPPATRPPVSAICGVPAALFAGIVCVATVVENHGLIAWRGLAVTALWTCLLAGLGLSVVALITGIHALHRPGRRRWSAVVGVASAVAALAVYALWFGFVVR